MNTRRTLYILAGLILGMVLSACGIVLSGPVGMLPQDLQATYIAGTVAAHIATATAQASPTPLPPSPTATLPPPEPTQTPEPTATPEPTSTPGPTATPTATPLPCDWASFQADVSAKDGTVFDRGARVVKTWRLKNIGSCTWTKDYSLVFVKGERMSGKERVFLPHEVLPGGMIDVSVELTAPAKAGAYKGYWQLMNASGTRFGVGGDTKGLIWVDIKVREVHRLFYNFALEACKAEWTSGAGTLGCPGTSGDPNGYAIPLSNPRLENRNEDEPAILVHPNLDDKGWITASYPLFQIKDGDRFRGWVGCAADSQGCDVLFRLEYRTRNGATKLLGEWREKYDGKVTVIDLDLSEYAEKLVFFTLNVSVKGQERNPEMANAIWFMPAIYRAEGQK